MAKGNRGGKRGMTGAIETGERDLDYNKVGASFSKLPRELKYNINKNMKISEAMKNDIMKNGVKTRLSDEWTTSVRDANGKKLNMRVLTEMKDGKLAYSVKKKNKYLQRNVTKERAANTVAKFYLDNMNK